MNDVFPTIRTNGDSIQSNGLVRGLLDLCFYLFHLWLDVLDSHGMIWWWYVVKACR
jgi:hypothetical protein